MGAKLKLTNTEKSNFEVSRSHTFTMAGQNFDRAVGGLNLVVSI